jgi:transcriptional regulator with XRE-family HTH domain
MKLRELMKKRKLSVADLAEKSGLSETYIRILLAGSKSPTLRTLEKLATALGVTVGELLDTQKAG